MSRKCEFNGRINIVSPGFNCASSVRFWYNSLRVQSYPHWKAYAISDASEDNTLEELYKISAADKRVEVISRTSHQYQLGNWYYTIRTIDSEEFVVRLDLDDFLGSKYVFENIIKEYLYRGAEVFSITEFPMDCYLQNDYSSRWYQKSLEELYNINEHSDSLFAFKAKYFKAIPKEHFLDEEGNFIKAAGDSAITTPILWQGFNYFHHLFIPNGLMYDTIRDPKYNDDNLKTEKGERLQTVLGKLFYERFRKLVDSEIIKTKP